MRDEEERSRREQQAKEEEEEGTHEEEDEGKEQDEGKEEEEEGEREKQQRMSKGKASSPSLSPSFVVRRLSASSWSWEVCRGRGMFLGVGLASSTVFPRGHFVVLSRLLAVPGRGDGLHPEADNADVGVLRPQGCMWGAYGEPPPPAFWKRRCTWVGIAALCTLFALYLSVGRLCRPGSLPPRRALSGIREAPAFCCQAAH